MNDMQAWPDEHPSPSRDALFAAERWRSGSRAWCASGTVASTGPNPAEPLAATLRLCVSSPTRMRRLMFTMMPGRVGVRLRWAPKAGPPVRSGSVPTPHHPADRPFRLRASRPPGGRAAAGLGSDHPADGDLRRFGRHLRQTASSAACPSAPASARRCLSRSTVAGGRLPGATDLWIGSKMTTLGSGSRSSRASGQKPTGAAR